MAFLANPGMYSRMLKDPEFMAQKEAEMWARNDPTGEIRGQQFDLKPPKKKARKAKAAKLENYFQVKKNSQGFAMKNCVFEKAVNSYVFVPKNYGSSKSGEFCVHCKLRPCIAEEHYSDMVDKASELSIEKRLDHRTIVCRLETLMKSFMRKYFGREYTRKNGLPQCVHEKMPSISAYTQKDYDSGSSSEDEEGEAVVGQSDSEDEFEF